MSRIDCITAVLAIPAVTENGEVRDARPGENILDEYVRRVEDDFAQLNTRVEDGYELVVGAVDWLVAAFDPGVSDATFGS